MPVFTVLIAVTAFGLSDPAGSRGRSEWLTSLALVLAVKRPGFGKGIRKERF